MSGQHSRKLIFFLQCMKKWVQKTQNHVKYFSQSLFSTVSVLSRNRWNWWRYHHILFNMTGSPVVKAGLELLYSRTTLILNTPDYQMLKFQTWLPRPVYVILGLSGKCSTIVLSSSQWLYLNLLQFLPIAVTLQFLTCFSSSNPASQAEAWWEFCLPRHWFCHWHWR